ncbi:MAG: cation transporter [Alphaproteobacteria bacterium]|nr:MAG: cation transporter [Alphaproteobacteria bacterium]
MSHQGSRRVIFAALAGNTLIAFTKYAAAAITGSSAMFSEAIHSTVDTGNQALLLYGLGRAERKPDKDHPFGYAQEVYFWAFMVAILVFAVGAGVSLYEGVHKVLHPEPLTNVYVNYIVLGMAMIFEAIAWMIAFREFNSRRGRRGFLQAMRESKDPSVMTVLLEDSAALLGLVVAFLGIFLGKTFDIPVLDGAASIVIGLILAGTATLLAVETKSLLIGESASPDIVKRIERLLVAHPQINRVNEILTMHLGPSDILLTLSVDFEDSLSAGDVEATITILESQIKHAVPAAKRIFIEVQSWQGHRRMTLRD